MAELLIHKIELIAPSFTSCKSAAINTFAYCQPKFCESGNAN